mgnify:CR=1 FL=1
MKLSMKINPELFQSNLRIVWQTLQLNCNMKTIGSFALTEGGLISIYFHSWTKSVFDLKWKVEDIDFFIFFSELDLIENTLLD